MKKEDFYGVKTLFIQLFRVNSIGDKRYYRVYICPENNVMYELTLAIGRFLECLDTKTETILMEGGNYCGAQEICGRLNRFLNLELKYQRI